MEASLPQTKTGLRKRLLLWLFSWQTLRRNLIAIVALITLAAVVVTEENWRGKRALENYKREWEARGERFDLEAFIPPPVSDAENYFATPFVAETLQGMPKTNAAEIDAQSLFAVFRGDPKLWPTNDGSWQSARLTDLKAWQMYFRALAEFDQTNALPVPRQAGLPPDDVLLALAPFDARLEELQKASQRRYFRQPLHYERGLDIVGENLPYLSRLKGCGQVLRLRAVAELNSGKSEEALHDVQLMFRVAESIHNQPLLISQLVRLGLLGLSVQPIYEGVVQYQWSDVQLADLEKELAKLDFLSDYHRVIRGERAFAIDSLERQRITREYKWVDDSSGIPTVRTTSFRFTPNAFFYQNELAFARLPEQFLLPLVDLEHRIVSPTAVRKADQEGKKQIGNYSPYRALALMTLPAVNRSVLRFAAGQNAVDLARVACALERYRLAQGGYPESLDALSPAFIGKLPTDVINGQPLKYHRITDERFLLYSVGWDEKDNGGTVALKKADRENGDWVWQMPPPHDSQKATKETKE